MDHRLEDYDAYLTLNRSLYFVTQAAARNIKRNGGGAIVNVGSTWARQAVRASWGNRPEQPATLSLVQAVHFVLLDDLLERAGVAVLTAVLRQTTRN